MRPSVAADALTSNATASALPRAASSCKLVAPRRHSASTDALRSAVLTAAMAPGINSYVFANMYGRARRVAASSVLIATSVSVGTIWVWLHILP